MAHEKEGEGPPASPLIQGILKYRTGLTEIYEGASADRLFQQVVVGRIAISNMEQQQAMQAAIEDDDEETTAGHAQVVPVESESFRAAMKIHEEKLK